MLDHIQIILHCQMEPGCSGNAIHFSVGYLYQGTIGSSINRLKIYFFTEAIELKDRIQILHLCFRAPPKRVTPYSLPFEASIMFSDGFVMPIKSTFLV